LRNHELTNSAVKNLRPEPKQKDDLDDALQSFGVRVNPGGSKRLLGLVAPGEDLTPKRVLTVREAFEWDADDNLSKQSESYQEMASWFVRKHIPEHLPDRDVASVGGAGTGPSLRRLPRSALENGAIRNVG
jgi:hypothetical protein